MPQRPVLSDYRAVLFDVDGTLIDSLEMIIRGLGDTAEEFSGRRPSCDKIRSLIGIPLAQQMAIYGGESAPIEAMCAHAVERMEHYSCHEGVFGPAIDALELIHRSGLKTALVTSKSQPEIGPFLSRFAGAAYVDAIICSSDVSHPKPYPDSALLACERLGVTPSSTILIGDSIYDMRCARAAGVTQVAVAYGAAPRDVLAQEDPDLILDTPDDLLAWAKTSLLQTSCREKS